MNYADFNKLMDKMVQEELAVGKTKGMEYTQGDRLDNFKRIGKEIGIEPELVLWVYLKKHLDSISSYIGGLAKGAEYVLSEPIESRIMDARVYLSLLRGLIEERKGEK